MGAAGSTETQSLDRSLATWSAQPDWDSDPALKSAGLVLGPVQAPLVQMLRMDPHFQLVYEDKLAAVFVARKRPVSSQKTLAPPWVAGCHPRIAARCRLWFNRYLIVVWGWFE